VQFSRTFPRSHGVDAPFVIGLAVGVEHLDAMVVAIRDEHTAVTFRDAARSMEESGERSETAPALRELPVGFEPRDALVAEVGDEHATRRIDRDVVRREQLAGTESAAAERALERAVEREDSDAMVARVRDVELSAGDRDPARLAHLTGRRAALPDRAFAQSRSVQHDDRVLDRVGDEDLACGRNRDAVRLARKPGCDLEHEARGLVPVRAHHAHGARVTLRDPRATFLVDRDGTRRREAVRLAQERAETRGFRRLDRGDGPSRFLDRRREGEGQRDEDCVHCPRE